MTGDPRCDDRLAEFRRALFAPGLSESSRRVYADRVAELEAAERNPEEVLQPARTLVRYFS